MAKIALFRGIATAVTIWFISFSMQISMWLSSFREWFPFTLNEMKWNGTHSFQLQDCKCLLIRLMYSINALKTMVSCYVLLHAPFHAICSLFNRIPITRYTYIYILNSLTYCSQVSAPLSFFVFPFFFPYLFWRKGMMNSIYGLWF